MKDFLGNGYRNPIEETRGELLAMGAPLLLPARHTDPSRTNPEFAYVAGRVAAWVKTHPYADREVTEATSLLPGGLWGGLFRSVSLGFTARGYINTAALSPTKNQNIGLPSRWLV
jgi:hypothetical protein